MLMNIPILLQNVYYSKKSFAIMEIPHGSQVFLDFFWKGPHSRGKRRELKISNWFGQYSSLQTLLGKGSNDSRIKYWQNRSPVAVLLFRSVEHTKATFFRSTIILAISCIKTSILGVKIMVESYKLSFISQRNKKQKSGNINKIYCKYWRTPYFLYFRLFVSSILMIWRKLKRRSRSRMLLQYTNNKTKTK